MNFLNPIINKILILMFLITKIASQQNPINLLNFDLKLVDVDTSWAKFEIQDDKKETINYFIEFFFRFKINRFEAWQF